jgi:protein SCO1/2
MSQIRLAALALGLAAVAGAWLAFVVSPKSGDAQAGPSLPKLHGQATWAPHDRQAPAFALRDQDGKRVSLTSLKKRPVLLTFLDSECHEQCPIEGRELGIMLRQLPAAARPTVVIVSVNPSGDTPASIRDAMGKWELDGPWRWHWLRGSRAELVRVWGAYGIGVEPTSNDITHGMALYLIGKSGDERAGYLFPFLPNFVALDLRTLAREQS